MNMTVVLKKLFCNSAPPAEGSAFASIKDSCTAANAAARYLEYGMTPLPVPYGEKAPVKKGWPTYKCAKEQVPAEFPAPSNVALLTGSQSGGLADVDLDSDIACKLAHRFLPSTACIFGRESRPASHHMYRVHGVVETVKYAVPISGKEQVIVEIRGENHATVSPPSFHSGERVRFEPEKAGLPTLVDQPELRRRVKLLAVASVIAQFWPKGEGYRQDLALAYAGGLLNRLPVDQVEEIIKAAATQAGDEEWKKRVQAVKETACKKAKQINTWGWPKVAELLGSPGSPIVGALQNWVADVTSSKPGAKLKLVTVSNIKMKPVEWLWEGWIERQALTLLDGDPGQGKSTIALDIAARASAGKPFPDGTKCDPCRVLIASCEDSRDSVIAPRLSAAGAKLENIDVIDGLEDPAGNNRMLEIPRDLPAIEAGIITKGARLVVIDPLVAYLGRTLNSNNDHNVRTALGPMAEMAQRCNVAILCIRHFSKQSGRSAMHKGGGSTGFIAAARSGLLVNKIPGDPTTWGLACGKSNHSSKPKTLKYRIVKKSVAVDTEAEVSTSGIEWVGTSELTSDELVAELDHEKSTALAKACEFLKDALKDGPLSSTELMEQAKAAGHAETTINRAKQELGIKPIKEKHVQGGKWLCKLP
jgi:hypothetical protein